MNHIVWVKEGGPWRVLACYETRREALRCLAVCREWGEEARYVVRDSYGDKSLRANVHQ